MTPRILRMALIAPIILASLFSSPAFAATGFHAAWVDQSPWPTLRPGATVSYTIHFRNTGDTSWNRGSPFRQANLAVTGDSTALADGGMAVGWLSPNRVARRPMGTYEGSLFVAQLKESDLRRFTSAGPVATQRDVFFDGTHGRIRPVRQSPDGSLYLTTSNGSGDRVIRITPTQ